MALTIKQTIINHHSMILTAMLKWLYLQIWQNVILATDTWVHMPVFQSGLLCFIQKFLSTVNPPERVHVCCWWKYYNYLSRVHYSRYIPYLHIMLHATPDTASPIMRRSYIVQSSKVKNYCLITTKTIQFTRFSSYFWNRILCNIIFCLILHTEITFWLDFSTTWTL